jgi:hypothetical protein
VKPILKWFHRDSFEDNKSEACIWKKYVDAVMALLYKTNK